MAKAEGGVVRHRTGVAAVVVACLGFSVSAMAQTRLPSVGTCQNETAQISVNFTGIEKDVTAAKAMLDEKIAEVKALATDQHFEKFDVQSFNYNINAYNRNTGGDAQFQYTGNANFVILPAEKAVDFMAMLVKKGYRASVNVNSYNNGSCSQS
jgi:hypothetical protein